MPKGGCEIKELVDTDRSSESVVDEDYIEVEVERFEMRDESADEIDSTQDFNGNPVFVDYLPSTQIELPGSVSKRLDLGKASAVFDCLTVSPRPRRRKKKTIEILTPWRRFVTKCFHSGSSASLSTSIFAEQYENRINNNNNNIINVNNNNELLAEDKNFKNNIRLFGGREVFAEKETIISARGDEQILNEQIKKQPFFRLSRFSNVPPTVCFYLRGQKVEKAGRNYRWALRWCHNSLIPKVIRKCLHTSHFSVTDEKMFWIGYWGRHLKSSTYKQILPYQKVNHFPGAFHIGRKDRLWGHIHAMATKWGLDHFNLMPLTYVMPKDGKRLKAALTGPNAKHLILKPPASARGTGIRIIHKWKQVPKKTPLIAQHYVDRPYLINGAKFDLRLYVYISSLVPLRVYIYEDGLVRFASVKYSNALSSLSNRFMHLTNYSINKVAHDNGEAEQQVDKWTIRQLWSFLQDCGHDVNKLMQKIIDLVLKTVISCEWSITEHMNQYANYPFTCHEIFGFDILLDEDIKPWLLEVNISPSLHSGTELDRAVKEPLARDVMNLSGVQIPDKHQAVSTRLHPDLETPGDPKCIDYRSKPFDGFLTEADRDKRERHLAHFFEKGTIADDIKEYLTSSDLRILIDTEDEMDRRGGFARIFPSATTQRYLKYFKQPHYADLLLNQWIAHYHHRRHQGCLVLESLCKERFHLATGQTNTNNFD